MPLIFQYGSNCDVARLNHVTRLNGAAKDRGRAATLDEYDIAFDVWSQGNGCAASDLIKALGTGRHAWGVLYELPTDRILGRNRPDGQKTLEEIEGKRYEPKPIGVRTSAGAEVVATTFVVKRGDRRLGLWTSADYVGHIVNGLLAHGIEAVDPDYIQHIIDIAIETNAKATEAAALQSRLVERLRRPVT